MNKYPLPVDRFFTAKRSSKALRKKTKFDRISAKSAIHSSIVRTRFGKRSQVIALLAGCAANSLKCDKYNVTVRLNKKFSIIEEPVASIKLITAFASSLHKFPRLRNIVFRYEELTTYDLAANALIDLIAVERSAEFNFKQTRKRLRTSGAYPRVPHVKRFIKAMGIIKHMNISHEAPLPHEAKELLFFDARNRNYYQSPDDISADFKDREQKKFVDHIDKCLDQNNWELSDEGKQSLLVYTGEILANAEEHADFVDWTIQGYLDKSLDPPICEIAIFNFGKSISKSLDEIDRSSYTWSQIKPYIDMHKSRGLFHNDWREQDLLTVVALQANVSRLNKSERTTRGQGTVDFISFFQEINRMCAGGHEKARMAIVSGSTYIYFDGKYELENRLGRGQTIAFNQANDLNLPPDPNYVKSLGNVYFPGTIISIKFPISPSSGTLVEDKRDEN